MTRETAKAQFNRAKALYARRLDEIAKSERFQQTKKQPRPETIKRGRYVQQCRLKGMTYKAIAEILGCSIQTARTALFRYQNHCEQDRD